MRRVLCLVGILVGLALAQGVGADSVESFPMGDTMFFRFSNETGMQVDGLLLKFAGPIDAPNWLAVGGGMVLESSIDGEIQLGGWLVPYGEILVDWPADHPRLTRAAWLVGGGIVEDLCVSCPTARIRITPSSPLAGEEVLFQSLSIDPFGGRLVQYEWEWDDGVAASGEVAQRTYVSPGRHEVTLTVWDEDHETGTETKRFSVSEVQEQFTLTVNSLVNVSLPFPLFPIGFRVYGPGIDFGFGLEGSPDPPFFVGTPVGTDNSETYPAGSSVTLTAETTGPGIHFTSWMGCSSTSGTTCTINMDRDTTVQAVFLVAGCFTADTCILMADGLRKRIADVCAGDMVMAYDFATALRVPRMVAQVFQFQANGFVRINDLEVTPTHRFAVGPDQWVEAGQLKIGDRVLNGGGFTSITRMEWVDEPAAVYTMTIEGEHNFFVNDGQESYLVHNVK